MIRGANVISVPEDYVMVVDARNSTQKNSVQFRRELEKAKIELLQTRPTAINLFWALKEIWSIVEKKKYSITELKEKILFKAEQIAENDIQINHMIGENGTALFNEGDSILTHCNAGSLATVSYGTALGVIRSVFKVKKNIRVFANESRPVLQDSRLTVWELQYENIPTTLICDSAAGFLMSRGKINKVIVGADRITANGDFANKIGTYSISVLAKEHQIPFFVAAPISTIDFSIQKGSEIPIEERNHTEVTTILGKSISPKDIDVYNPAFDVTPKQNVSAFITEKGVIFPPFVTNLKKL